jgi:hypothetical protein
MTENNTVTYFWLKLMLYGGPKEILIRADRVDDILGYLDGHLKKAHMPNAVFHNLITLEGPGMEGNGIRHRVCFRSDDFIGYLFTGQMGTPHIDTVAREKSGQTPKSDQAQSVEPMASGYFGRYRHRLGNLRRILEERYPDVAARFREHISNREKELEENPEVWIDGSIQEYMTIWLMRRGERGQLVGTAMYPHQNESDAKKARDEHLFGMNAPPDHQKSCLVLNLDKGVGDLVVASPDIRPASP